MTTWQIKSLVIEKYKTGPRAGQLRKFDLPAGAAIVNVTLLGFERAIVYYAERFA